LTKLDNQLISAVYTSTMNVWTRKFTVNGIMAVILRDFSRFGSYGDQLRKSDCLRQNVTQRIYFLSFFDHK